MKATCIYCIEEFDTESDDPDDRYCSELCRTEHALYDCRQSLRKLRSERDKVTHALRSLWDIVEPLYIDELVIVSREVVRLVTPWLSRDCSICRGRHGPEITHEAE